MNERGNLQGHIAYDDLREWLDHAERLGEVRHVKGATWQEDIGLAAEAILRAENGPCVVFDDIPGCPKGFRLLLNIFAGTRRNMTFGFPDHLGKWELSEAYRDAYLKDMKLVPHEMVADGPVLENIMTGDDVDVLKFPSPVWHEKDGGRYIGTGTYSITRDPDENWLNAGAYRAQVHDRNSVGVLMATGHHGYLHREKYWKKGEPLPIVMVLGGDPLAFFYGGTEAPYGVFEMDIIGGLRGRPVKMVKGRVTGLPFPAHAEIVLEGYITPDKRATEGPFGEWTGHYAGGAAARPVLDIKAIYHRNDPILLGVPPMGAGPDEMARYRAVLRSAMVKQNMTAAGVPEVVQVWCHEIGGSRLLHGVAIKQKYPGHATQAGFIAAQCGAAAYASKYVIVVDDDVDVTNLDHLLWAMLTRTEPKESIQFIQNAWDSPADPRLAPEKRAVGDMTHSVAVINACKPYHWRDKFPPSNTPSPEITRKAKEKFGWLLDGKKGP
ncbi:MAG TPA: UbiD family decarboxylase [Xanthobacteraceae bacterium]|jgi:4-hydroxy-3-polyprenylbenzoate decarboxylase|nr:UbiD family decarboxylase [Xanthobacteraceae bacterium]